MESVHVYQSTTQRIIRVNALKVTSAGIGGKTKLVFKVGKRNSLFLFHISLEFPETNLENPFFLGFKFFGNLSDGLVDGKSGDRLGSFFSHLSASYSASPGGSPAWKFPPSISWASILPAVMDQGSSCSMTLISPNFQSV